MFTRIRFKSGYRQRFWIRGGVTADSDGDEIPVARPGLVEIT
jgi:hypothetical protein